MRRVYLTTIDNPYSPHTQFKEWYAYDIQAGHHSCSRLAKVARTSDSLSEVQNQQAIERAVDELVSLNLLNNDRKLVIEED